MEIGAGEFLEGKARDLRDHIIDGRLEGSRRRALGDVVFQLVERIADGQPRRDLGDGKARGLRRQRRGARHARVHLDDDQLAIGRIDRELHVRAAGIHADLAQHRDRGVAHDLIFFVGERQRRGDGDRIASMHAHRIDILDGADDDAVVRAVADHLHLIFLPAEDRFLDQDLARRRGVQPALDDPQIFLAIIGDAAARAAQREGRPDDRRQADDFQRLERLDQVMRQHGARGGEADGGHRLAEAEAVFGLVDGVSAGADHLDAEAGRACRRGTAPAPYSARSVRPWWAAAPSSRADARRARARSPWRRSRA